MSIIQRGRRFHYRFMVDGVVYSGPCNVPAVPGNATPEQIAELRAAAEKFEADEKNAVTQNLHKLQEKDKEIRMNKSVVALIENYKFELSGGRPIHFSEAFALAAAKPSRRKAESSFAALRQTYWNDFSAFMDATFPEVKDLAGVLRRHCEAYVSYLAENGRFVRKVQYSYTPNRRKRSLEVSYETAYKISHKTIKEIVRVCKWVFSRLSEDAGLVRDPWKEVVLPDGESIDREIFTEDELRLIWEGMQSDPFCYHLFMIAANSGMTEGDICTLEWSHIFFAEPVPCIRRKRRKTGANISLPLLPQLQEYLLRIPRTGKYVSPVHAEMYLRQSGSVSERVKKFLHRQGIVTTVQVEGRRAQSVKDLHSMRHVFCYTAKRAGIPESSIMQMVGHEVLAMTQHYADHDTIADLARDMKKLPVLFAGEPGTGEDVRKELAELAYSLPIEQVKELLALAGVRATA